MFSLERDVESSSRSIFLFEHDLFGKPVPTFPDHALEIPTSLRAQAKQSIGVETQSGLLRRGVYHRAGRRPDPLAPRNDGGNSTFVMPGGAQREPGIHTPDRGYGFRACAKGRIPE